MDKRHSYFEDDTKQQQWLEPTAAALAKLDEIQSSVYSMKPASTYNVQSVWCPSSSTPTPVTTKSQFSSTKASPYTELETKPPLSSVSIQKNAWGSNTSIPDLIKAQGERQKQRVAGGPKRPWSGRKVPPSPTAQRRNSGAQPSSKGASGKEIKDAFIAVKGSKSVMYDAGSRPPSGRYQPSPSSTVPPANSPDVFELMEAANSSRQPGTNGEGAQDEDNALEEFLKSQPNGHKHELSKLSAAYADERNITPPPPPPCASPDLEKLINGGLIQEDWSIYNENCNAASSEENVCTGTAGDGENGVREISVKQPPSVPQPQLLRRPTPEPLRLSMHLPDAEGEEDYSTDEDRLSDAPSPCLSPDIDIQSVTSEVSAQLAPHSPRHEHPSLNNSPSHSGVISISVTPRGGDTTSVNYRGDEIDHPDNNRNLSRTRKGKQSVQIDEERNITFDITPRNSVSSHRPVPPNSQSQRRPRSALKSASAGRSNLQKSKTTSDRISLNQSKSYGAQISHHSIGDRGRSSKHSDCDLEEDDTDDDDINGIMMDMLNSGVKGRVLDNSTRRKKREVETMMSRLAVSDNVNEHEDSNTEVAQTTHEASQLDVVRTVQVSSSSSSRQNYYEKAIQSRKRNMYTKQSKPGSPVTTKVIEFGDDGPTMETREASFLQVVAPPSQAKPVRPTSARGGLRRGWEEASTGPGRTQATRATSTMKKTSLARPTSRMGSYRDAEDVLEADRTQKALQRALPRSAVLKAKPEVTPHRCRRKSPTQASGKPRPHSSFVNSNSPKKPVRRRSSSPSAQTHSNSSRALTPPGIKSKAEMQRNREAVRALKDGSLKKTKAFDKKIIAVTDSPIIDRASRLRQDQDEDKSDSESIEFPKTVQEEEIYNLHRHLARNGVKISYKTLKRGLVAPDEKKYEQCFDQLPSSVSFNLLSKPEAWLGPTYERYKMAENALRRADTQLAIQEEKTRLEAEELLAAMKAVNSKKKKKKKTKGSAKKKAKSGSRLSGSAVSLAQSTASATRRASKSLVDDHDGGRRISALAALGLDPEEALAQELEPIG